MHLATLIFRTWGCHILISVKPYLISSFWIYQWRSICGLMPSLFAIRWRNLWRDIASEGAVPHTIILSSRHVVFIHVICCEMFFITPTVSLWNKPHNQHRFIVRYINCLRSYEHIFLWAGVGSLKCLSKAGERTKEIVNHFYFSFCLLL